MRTLPRLLAILSGLLLAGSLSARDLAVSPLRLDLPANKAMTVLTVTNQGSETLLLQAGVKRWSQEGGDNSYSTDNTMIATPALFRLPPGQRQLVRVGWRRQAQPGMDESAWRVFVEEVPEAGNSGSDNGLRVALRLGIPLFVPGRQPGTASLDWQWLPAGPDHPARLRVSNNGHAHARITSIRGEQAGAPTTTLNTLLYVLPGAEQRVQLPAAFPPGISRLTVTDAEGSRSYPLSAPAP